jgi:hypothetical protein
MQRILRYVVTAAAAVFAIVSGTLFRQAIEVYAEEQGWDRWLVDGWQAMTDLGLATWIAAGFFFFAGASVALWADLWLRRLTSKTAREARIILRWGRMGTFLAIRPSPISNIGIHPLKFMTK